MPEIIQPMYHAFSETLMSHGASDHFKGAFHLSGMLEWISDSNKKKGRLQWNAVSQFILINSTPCGLWYNLFHAGVGIYAHPMISREKKVFAEFILNTQSTTKIGLHTKKQVSISINKKNGGRFKIWWVRLGGVISSIFCIFYLLPLKWLYLGQFWS